jgi:alpha-galactosidase
MTVRAPRRLLRALAGLFLAAVLAAAGGPPARAVADVLAPTPYMGWDTYFALGGHVNEQSILTEAHDLVAGGLARSGYHLVWLDVGWWNGARDASGNIVLNPAQWPHGLAWLTQQLHASGLQAGIYTDAGTSGCGGPADGSEGHYQQDANTFAAWGFDAVKVDFCGGLREGLDPRAAYGAVHSAIAANASHRPMLLAVCDFAQPGQFAVGVPSLDGSTFSTWSFAPAISNSWRTDTDVGFPGNVVFPNVLRNLDADAAHPEVAGPGHWNDPDYLAPDQGLSDAQFQTQMSMWSMLAAPLMVSADLQSLSPTTARTVTNREVIWIDQDPAGVQGTLVASSGDGQVWARPLSDGSRAVALLNRGDVPLAISASAIGVGLPRAARYGVRDVWAHRTNVTRGTLAATVPPGATVLLRVWARPASPARHRPRRRRH